MPAEPPSQVGNLIVTRSVELEGEPPAQTAPFLSVCLIVKNEERVLAACLRSLSPWADEVIVVDTGSTDRTVEIAKQHGAKVFHFPWTDSFSEARNESLRHATGRWLLWVDADDTVPPDSAAEIVRAAREASDDTIGYIVPVRFVEDGGTASGTQVDHIKLFRNLPGVAFERRIHEQILPSLQRLGGRIVRCNAVVLHSGYDTSPEGQAKKHARDLHILHLELQERPGDPFVRFNLGMTYHYMHQHTEAVRWLKACLALADPTESIVRKAYALLAVSLREQGDLPIALTASFYEDETKLRQWNAFLQKSTLEENHPPLGEVIAAVREFLMPPTTTLSQGLSFDMSWPAGGPWMTATNTTSSTEITAS